MNKYCYLLLFSLLVVSGCSDSSRPADLPPLFPCTVLVTQGGVPLGDAIVELRPEDAQKYRPTAITNAEGKAVMGTYGYPGAPVGKYKIVVSKIIEDNVVDRIDEFGKRVVMSRDRYQVVEDRFSKPETSPHEIEITSKRVQTEIDVGNPVRQPISDIR